MTFYCRKIAWRCGETHICKSKCAKHDGFGALLSVQMLKNCTPLWRKAHLQVKMFKNCSLRSTFGRSDVSQFYAAVAKSTFGSASRTIFVAKGCSKTVCSLWRRSRQCVVYVIECLWVHSVIASRRLQKEKDATSSKLSGVSGWTGWSRRTVRR